MTDKKCDASNLPNDYCLRPQIANDWPAELRIQIADTLFTSISAGVCVTDAHERIVEVNPTLCELTGFKKAELIGKTPRLFHSGLQSMEYYNSMWTTLHEKGQWTGEIWNRNRNGVLYAARLGISAICDPLMQVTHYLGVLNDITRSKLIQMEFEKNATHDPLTGLPNRCLLTDRMHQAMAQSTRTKFLLAICFLDLDGFKKINDVYGHASGDRVLCEVATRLKLIVRDGDTVARLGGDEFVLLLWGLDQIDECKRTLNRIIEEIARPIVLSRQLTSLTASVGIALFPNDGTDQQELLARADSAMYRSKLTGGNRLCFFSDDG